MLMWPQFWGKNSRIFQGLSSTFSILIPAMLYQLTTLETRAAEDI